VNILIRARQELRAAWRSQAGYTLVELIGAMTIFALIMVVAIGAFVTLSGSATKTGAQRRVQQDSRYNIEELARQTRSSSIDYAFYKNTTDPRCTLEGRQTLALFFTEASEGNAPVTRRLIYYWVPAADASHVGEMYKYESNDSSSTPSCGDIRDVPLPESGSPSRIKATSESIDVKALAFYISPVADPYAPPSADCTEVCRRTHPRVTMVITARFEGPGIGVSSQSKASTVTIETTVGSRAYPFDKTIGGT
jgi:prepilin-type N-terminal cleavage/methylation domain-containing protein